MSKIIVRTSLIFLYLVLVCSPGVQAQNTKRGFKLLEKVDYEKAKELFHDAYSENKDDPTALFGLALIMADDKSPYFDIIEAWKYARLLKSNIDLLNTEQSEFIGEYFYNTEARHVSRPVKKKIEYAVETIESKLIKYIREENNLEIVYRVLKEFPDFKYFDNITHIRNQLEFRKYEKQNTLTGYLEFLEKFPDAAQVDKAKRYRNKLAYEEALKMNNVDALKSYMKKYPEAAEINLAIKKLHAVAFDKAKQTNTIQALDDFIAEFPDALEISEARIIQKQLLYEYAKKIQTLQAYNDFIRKYPDGQQYIDIFNLKSLDNGMRFIAQHVMPGNNIQWARSFEEEGNEELSSTITVDTLNNYIVGGTVFRSDTGSTDAWIIKLNPEGKMIWNKYVGEAYNDQLNMLAISNRNEILGAGFTWTGIDSSSRESWLFKMSSDGRKLWSKKLGQMHINTMMVSRSGNIFLGGYLVNDSLQPLYSVVVLNESGKRMWGRTYTGQGEIVNITECFDHNILITGTRWSAKIDPRGYLTWENTFKPSDSITFCSILPKGEICYLGTRNKNQLIFIRTGADNKPMIEKELSTNMLPIINSVVRGGSNQLIALISYETQQTITRINTVNGEILGSSDIPGTVMLQNLTCDRNNNLLMQACNREIILIRNNGIAF